MKMSKLSPKALNLYNKYDKKELANRAVEFEGKWLSALNLIVEFGAIIKGLSDRHQWTPHFDAPCICEWHEKARKVIEDENQTKDLHQGNER
jgi:hypothetical protein